MKTYTHSNGNTYNVSIANGIVTLSSNNNTIAPMQITESNFNKLQTKNEVVRGSVILNTITNQTITLYRVTETRISWYGKEEYKTLGSINKKAIALWITKKQFNKNIESGTMIILN